MSQDQTNTLDSQLGEDVEHHLRAEADRGQLESSLAPEETPPHDSYNETPGISEQTDSLDPLLGGYPEADVGQFDGEQSYQHEPSHHHPAHEAVDEAAQQPDQEALATYLQGSEQLAPLDSTAAPRDEEVRQGIPSLPVLPSTDYQPPHFSYPTSDYIPTSDHTSAPEQYYPSTEQPAYPSYRSYPQYGDSGVNGEASAEAGPSSAHGSNWAAAQETFDSYGPSAAHASGDLASTAQPYYPSDPTGVEPAFAELVQQHSTASTGSNYYLNYPGDEGGPQVEAYGPPGGDDEELEPAEHLDVHEGGEDKGKKRSADGKVKKDGEKAPRTPGQKAPPKEVKLGPDGKPKIELACNPCRQRKIRCDSSQPNCSTCVRRSIQCVYPTERRFRGPGRKKNPPHILNPDGSLVGSLPSPSASPHPLEIGPDGQPIIPPPQLKKKKLTKKARLAQEAEEAAAREHHDAGAESGLGHLDHQIHEHLMLQHHKQQMERFSGGEGEVGDVSATETDAMMIAEALVGAAALGGMSGGVTMEHAQEQELQQVRHDEGGGALHEMSGHQEGAPVGEYLPQAGEADATGQHLEMEAPVQEEAARPDNDTDAV